MRNIKVLWCANTPCGSVRRTGKTTIAGGWLVSLEEELKKIDGIDLYIAYSSTIDEPPFDFEGVHYFPIVDKRPLGILGKLLYDRRSEKSKEVSRLPKLLNIIETIKPDIIHVHGTEECFGKIVEKYNSAYPIVISIQGMLSPYLEKYFAGLPESFILQQDSIKNKILGKDVKHDWNSFRYRAKREISILQNCRYVLGRTFWDRDCTLAINSSRQYHVVNEILRLPFYNKAWKGFIAKEKITIVSIVSGGIYKGYETVLKTANLLKSFSKIDFEWKIVGYDAKRKWVTFSEKAVGIKSNDVGVSLLGRMAADELALLLSKSDMYVHVSHIENSPNSVCEAMLIGMPIVATYAGGTASLLRHEVEGVLCQDGDPYVLAGAILDYTKNPQTAVSYAKRAREIALQRHDKQSIVLELSTAYTEIINDFHSQINNVRK